MKFCFNECGTKVDKPNYFSPTSNLFTPSLFLVFFLFCSSLLLTFSRVTFTRFSY